MQTPFRETDALLAALDNDDEALLGHLARMHDGEVSNLRRAALNMAFAAREELDRRWQQAMQVKRAMQVKALDDVADD
jgi:hypothetical protein